MLMCSIISATLGYNFNSLRGKLCTYYIVVTVVGGHKDLNRL